MEDDNSGSCLVCASHLANHLQPMLSSIIFHDLSEEVGSFHESSGEDSGVFAVVSWHDSVQGLAVSRCDGVISSEVRVCT